MKVKKYGKVGKLIKQKNKEFGRADKTTVNKVATELNQLTALKQPGTMLFIDDGHFFDKPHRGGHMYIVDEYSGEKVAVNRMTHMKGDQNKVALQSMAKAPDGTPTFVHLDVIYSGKKGKPIKLKETKLPGRSVPRPSEDDLEMVHKMANRDREQREKWRKK